MMTKTAVGTNTRTPRTSARLGSVIKLKIMPKRTEPWLSEDYCRQRCEVRARRDAKMCCRILTALGRKEWRTWNDVPLELRKDIERIHRNLGHASADQLEKLFRDATCVR